MKNIILTLALALITFTLSAQDKVTRYLPVEGDSTKLIKTVISLEQSVDTVSIESATSDLENQLRSLDNIQAAIYNKMFEVEAERDTLLANYKNIADTYIEEATSADLAYADSSRTKAGNAQVRIGATWFKANYFTNANNLPVLRIEEGAYAGNAVAKIYPYGQREFIRLDAFNIPGIEQEVLLNKINENANVAVFVSERIRGLGRIAIRLEKN